MNFPISAVADDLDRKLIHALQLDGRAPFSRIADVFGVSDQTIARRYRRLRSQGVLRIVGVPPANYVAHGRWLLRLRCAPGAAQSVAATLARRPDTAWVQIVSGGTELLCIARTRSQVESEQLLLAGLPRGNRVVAIAAHSVLHTYYGSPGRIRSLEALSPEEVQRLSPEPAPEIDDIQPLDPGDQQLLDILARDGRAGHAELAAATGWSQSTVGRRLDHLRGIGVLHYYAEFDLSYVGFHTAARLWATVAPAELVATGQALAGHPEVVFAAATTGPTNLAVQVVCRNSRELYRYLTERVAALKSIGHVETAPIVQNVKRVGAVLDPAFLDTPRR
ncbi:MULTISPECIES: Lrp/AsnC family transcriptional regulator [Streptosporangium]|uniref:DNA-binding Lrp family transcriptional regulator n=1 Tax=Streptosporangium brasiliense TaxID=47480 RepID=A0ABT9RHY6_9ACTN|nr:AsnC family transcriptional regulator [Streptosporangium brasiliense]MDP9868901.1 DNA-binding Lrp family transcriptional regulator [Streptosporangium brasiliense]